MGKQDKLLNLLAYAYEQEQALVEALSEEERPAEGVLERWSAKDMVAHIAAWHEKLAQSLAAVSAGALAPRFEHFDPINAEIFEQHRRQPWPEVLAYAQGAHRQVLEQVARLEEADLDQPMPFEGRTGQSLWREIASSGIVHPLLHQSDFYLKRGDGERAAGVQEAAVGRLAELDDSPEWRSIPIYNLACYDALCGQSEKALDWLREALALNPGFVEWSRQDPDLESLRGLPGYQAIYSSG